MTREIKFRAWDKKNKRMMELGDIFKCFEAGNYLDNLREDLIIIMQYTGLKDKNGKEIYEGDFVYLAGYGNYQVVFPFIELYEAEAEKDIGEIIGNIYEKIL